jgi:acyl homoserine lactone synthase
MEYISGTSQGLTEHFKNQFFKYRFDVFVERLGWDLDTAYGMETDQFDHEGTVYVIARDEHSQITGCARLLPTTSPYLLEKIFPELLNGLKPPKSPEIWELSRFTSLDLNGDVTKQSSQFSSPTTIELLLKTIECAKENGAKRIISVSPIGIERLLRKAGFKAHRAGPPKIIGGYPLFACWIEL